MEADSATRDQDRLREEQHDPVREYQTVQVDEWCKRRRAEVVPEVVRGCEADKTVMTLATAMPV
jgi:hypothetical protein